MWIESITIHGFGCLADRHCEFPRDRAALVIDENERGKSTLAAAIVAGLCGFPRRRAGGEAVKLSEVYRPWRDLPQPLLRKEGSPACFPPHQRRSRPFFPPYEKGTEGGYALEMQIEAGGARLIVERDFAADSFAVRDRDTNRDVTAQFNGDLALHFLRLPRDDFQRIAFISGKEVSRFSSSANLRERLSAVAEGSTGDPGAEVAIAALAEARYVLDGSSVKPETAVKRLTGSIDEKTARMKNLDAELDAASEQVGELDELQAKHEELAQQSADLDSEYAAARLAEVRERIQSARSDIDERDALARELTELEPYAGFPAERVDQLSGAVGRSRELARQLEEKLARQRLLNSEADGIRARVEPLGQFALATNEDLVGLAAASEALAEAQAAVGSGLQKQAAAGRRRPGLVGRILLVAGALCGLVSIGLAVLQVVDVAWSVPGVLIGSLAAAIGGSVLVRAASIEAGAKAASEQAAEAHKQARARAARRLSALGVQCDDRSELVDSLRRARDALERYLADRDRLDAVGRELLSVEREIEDLRTRADEERRIIGSVLRDAGVDEALPLEESLVRFDEAGKRHARYRQIADSALPAVQKRVLSEDALARLISEEKELAGQSGDSRKNGPRRWSLEIETDRQVVRRELEETASRIGELERGVGLKVAEYRREYPALEDEVRELTAELRRATRYKAAIERAAEVLREVAEGSRRRWAAALNERASAILPSLNPDYDTLRFDDSLDFTVRRVPDSRIIQKQDIDARLSTGAKDQVYLAVRLACCDELSAGGESIPIILDDALISFDDDRFASSLRHIAETLPLRHQVIVLTCHRDRHERLAREDWFRESAAVVSL